MDFMPDKNYAVVYPRGDRTTLATAYLKYGLEEGWDMAARERFETREEADEHARNLAAKFGLALHEDIERPAALLDLDDDPPVRAAGSDDLRIFSWLSEAMEGYYRGEIYAVARDADEARRRVKATFEAERDPTYEDRWRLDSDLQRDPDIQPLDRAILIRGGD